MSHYLTLVLVPEAIRDLHGEVSRLLAPYAHEGEAGMRDCYCRGHIAREEARQRAEELCPLTELRIRYGLGLRQRMREQQQRVESADTRVRVLAPFSALEAAAALRHRIFAPYHALRAQVWAEHPERDQADPTCPACRGSGRFYVTPHTPRWDEWVLGGRWYGLLSGRRIDPLLRTVADDVLAAEENCVPAHELALDGWLPFAMVTPAGEWFDGATAGEAVRGARPRPHWRSEVKTLVARHPASLAVACDLELWD